MLAGCDAGTWAARRCGFLRSLGTLACRATNNQPTLSGRVAVIGGGSSGVQAVAALACEKERQILWYDDAGFMRGRLSTYRDIKANTKLEKLEGVFRGPEYDYWRRLHPPLAEVIDRVATIAWKLPEQDEYDPSDGWNYLGVLDDVFLQLQQALQGCAPNVEFKPCRAELLEHRPILGTWEVHSPDGIAEVDAIVLATGGMPRRLPLPSHEARDIPLYTALNPKSFAEAIHEVAAGLPVRTAAVLGISHSAVTILEHLEQLGVPRRICFARRPAKHAEWVEDANDYRFTMSGLKGPGSLFARKNCLDRWGVPHGHTGVTLLPWDQIYSGALDEVDIIVQAVGFDGAPLPSLSMGGVAVAWSVESLQRDLVTSQLHLIGNSAPALKHLYGTGMAFPEDAGFCRPSPDERPVGFSFAKSTALRCASHLQQSSL